MSHELMRDGRVIMFGLGHGARLHVQHYGPSCEVTLDVPHGLLATEMHEDDLRALAAWITDRYGAEAAA